MKLKHEIRRLIIVFICIANILPLTGCFDQREIDDLAYPLAMGLDLGVADNLRLTLQLASPLSIGGGGGGSSGGGGGGKGGGGEGPTSIITVDAPSIFSGLNMINNIISKEINMAHTKLIVFSKPFAERGVEIYLHSLHRGREFRPDIYVAVSNEPPDQYLKAVKPTLESSPAKYYELMLGKGFTSFYPTVRLNDFYFRTESDAIEPVAILTGLSNFKTIDDLKKVGNKKSGTEIKPEGHYEAGSIPVIADQKNEFTGVAVFKNGKMVATMKGLESSCMQLVTGEYKNAYWTLPDAYKKDKVVVMKIFQRKKPMIKAEVKNGKPSFKINLDLEGDFTAIQSGINYENYPEAMEKGASEMIKEEITAMLKRTQYEFDSDICGFGRYMKGKFLTWAQWKKYDWPDQYKKSSFEINVKFKVRRTGLMIRSIEH
ncbi:MAG TPA: Ger(x)C family spore germination protein [Clostridia bacterium]|nr:Ger(x)C family spore germination protein [Clostridia bacterium]